MTSDAGAVEAVEVVEDEPLSVLGAPGLKWTGDGTLAPDWPPKRSALDVEFEVYPPVLEEGEKGFPLATFNRRWVGYVIDRVIIIALVFLITVIVGPPESADAGGTAQELMILSLVELGFGLIFNPRGWSPGKQVMGLRIVNYDGDPPGLRWGIMRTFGAVLSGAFFNIGYFWAFFDKKNQTLHDKLAKTYVVYIDEGAEVTNEAWRRR
jgi:uncharacterized RDD family membrane protein YckC